MFSGGVGYRKRPVAWNGIMTRKLHLNSILILTRSLSTYLLTYYSIKRLHLPNFGIYSKFEIETCVQKFPLYFQPSRKRDLLKLYDSQEGIGAFFAKRHLVWKEQWHNYQDWLMKWPRANRNRSSLINLGALAQRSLWMNKTIPRKY